MKRTLLTKTRLDAFRTALGFYLAGPVDDDDPIKRKEYEAAQRWANEELERRGGVD